MGLEGRARLPLRSAKSCQHLCETYEDKAALEEALARPVPNVSQVQALFETAAKARLRPAAPKVRRHAARRRDRRSPAATGSSGRAQVKAGTLLARRAWEECYHTGQVVFIRLATDPAWNQEAAVYGRTKAVPRIED